MKGYGIDYYVIPTDDFHASEYVGAYFETRSWISGFTGSAGTLVVGHDFAGLWTDGRYFLQADKELATSCVELYKMGEENVPTTFEYIENEEIIVTNNISGDTETFNKNGSWYYGYTNECMLFPSKDQRDWSKFYIEPEMIDGEFYYCFYGDNQKENSFIFIYKKHILYKTKCYAALSMLSSVLFKDDLITNNNENITELRKATVEEKQQLLDAIKIRNYEWNADKKELVKIESKFDIATLQPFDKVLVRDKEVQSWRCDFYNSYAKSAVFQFITVRSINKQCIPYNEDTKHLVGSNERPSKKYRTWEE